VGRSRDRSPKKGSSERARPPAEARPDPPARVDEPEVEETAASTPLSRHAEVVRQAMARVLIGFERHVADGAKGEAALLAAASRMALANATGLEELQRRAEAAVPPHALTAMIDAAHGPRRR
jgi:hypothetical protein